MSAFIQISDTHIVPENELAYGRSDTAAALESAVSTINAKLSMIDPVACAVVTGDLTDHGTQEEYVRFKAIMSRLELPYVAIPGNHDHRETMRAAFADEKWMPKSGPIQWKRDFGAFTIIALDTLEDDAHHGILCEEGFAFVDNTLKTLQGQPVVIATHHPWIHTGLRMMDADNLRNGAELMRKLEAYSGSVRMISGHVHRAITGQIGKITCQIAPATCHSVHFNQQTTTPNSLIMEQGGVTHYSLHKTPQPNLISNIIPIGDFAGPWPFYE